MPTPRFSTLAPTANRPAIAVLMPEAPTRGVPPATTPTTTPRSQDISIVNLAARQRMLSQRLILQILLAARGDTTRLDEAGRTLQLFAESDLKLKGAATGWTTAEARRIHDTYRGPSGVGPVIDEFMRLVREAIDGITHGSAAAPAAIALLVDQTDRVLVALDTATTAFDDITRGRSGAMLKELVNIVGDIQGVAKEAKIVSFNAQVMAARAGQHGREFAVVANVLSNITDVIDGLTRKAAVLAEQRHTLAT